jgi:hypothetical protein
VNPADLHLFFEDFVRELRSRGVLCAITSGLACVHYGIAETTKDCDLLCHPDAFQELLNLLSLTQIQNATCGYRGNISPPLDPRWHRGGWTSHFEWLPDPGPVTLDVFGHAVRESTPWERELLGLYAGPQTVAEMKRTNRDKDWPFITALGERMIEADDQRGWLHIFNIDTLNQLFAENSCPPELIAQRPALQLSANRDPRAVGALNAERRFWEELDRRRIQILERHLRPYVSAVRKGRHKRQLPLRDDHSLRVACASEFLPTNPLKDYGLQKHIDEAKAALVKSGVIPEAALTWLPNAMIYFDWLNK